MELLPINFENIYYPFYLGTDCSQIVNEQLVALGADTYFIVADKRVARLYGEDLRSDLSNKVVAHLIQHQEGEKGKTLSTVEFVIEEILKLGASRSSCIVALGGGVTGNLAGLVAALAFRGIRLVHIPTTVVAMLDSVLSLKQAVNASCGKNLVGTFYIPELVLADISYLRTLPKSHVRSGLCEVIKNALAIEPNQIPFLREVINKECEYDKATYRELILRSVQAKCSVMKNDKHERHSGLVLEYGHTVGHAIEHVAAGNISHGESVGLGMLVAAEVGTQIGNLSPNEYQLHWELLTQVGIPLKLPSTTCLEKLLLRIFSDNKRGYLSVGDDMIPMVILEALGKPKWNNSSHPLFPVHFSSVKKALKVIHY